MSTIYYPLRPTPVSHPVPPDAQSPAGLCWLWMRFDNCWRLMNPENTGALRIESVASHWLPFNAIPIPSP